MKVELITEYKAHGLSLSGNLAIVRYYEDMKADPQFGNYGSMLPLDYAEKAETLLMEAYPDATILVIMPSVVARLEEG